MTSSKAVLAVTKHGVATALGLFLLLVPCAALADEVVDPSPPQTVPTQLRGMHAREDAHLVVGVQVNGDRLLCSSAFTSFEGARSRFVDNGSSVTVGGFTLHGCPPNYAVKGIHLGSHLLICERASVDENRLVADKDARRAGMRACPAGMLMKGFDADRDVLACVATR